jgi:hypothetical protein
VKAKLMAPLMKYGGIVVCLLVLATAAQAFGPGLGNRFGKQGAFKKNSGAVGPQPTGDILMVDGTSLILQTNGTSFVCRAGGC